MSDYPAGAEHDPDAPYNEKDYGDCGHCSGEGNYKAGPLTIHCPHCDGTGKKSE
jgi:hypothetical protein